MRELGRLPKPRGWRRSRAPPRVARLAELVARERQQVGRGVAGGDEVVQSRLGAGLAGRQIDDPHHGLEPLEERAVALECRKHLGLDHRVGVEAEVNDAAVPRDQLVVGQRRLAVVLVPPAPRRHAWDRDRVQAGGGGRIRLARALGDKQRDRRVGERRPDAWRDVQHQTAPARELVLPSPALDHARLVRPELHELELPADGVDRDHQRGDELPLRRPEPPLELGRFRRAPVTPLGCNLIADRRFTNQPLMLRKEAHVPATRTLPYPCGSAAS